MNERIAFALDLVSHEVCGQLAAAWEDAEVALGPEGRFVIAQVVLVNPTLWIRLG